MRTGDGELVAGAAGGGRAREHFHYHRCMTEASKSPSRPVLDAAAPFPPPTDRSRSPRSSIPRSRPATDRPLTAPADYLRGPCTSEFSPSPWQRRGDGSPPRWLRRGREIPNGA